MKKETPPKTCHYCQTPLSGRRDKKFCDANCRALFHQEKQKKEEAEYLRILGVLKKNRKILKSLNPSGHSTIRKSVLVKLGYDFNYFTNIYQPRSGGIYYFCFEFGFREITDAHHKINIVNLQPYMAKYRHPIWRHSQEQQS